jgi:hypothetical protein
MVSDDQYANRIKLLEAAAGLGLSAWCLWTVIPEHRRQLWRMGLLSRLHRWTAVAARRTAVASMGAELASGQENYTVPYSLSLLRDRLTVAYGRARGVTP